MLIDTHCHLDFDKFDNDRDDVIGRAKSVGVARIVNVASSIDGVRRSIELANKYDMVYAAVGIHPHEAGSATDDVIEGLRPIARQAKVVAIGEVGLDYYRNLSPKDVQERSFRKFIRLAEETGLPLILHVRDAGDDFLKILRDERKGSISGVMHCFSGDADFLKECLNMGLYISFTCNLTFKNAKDIRETARAVPLERLLLETDAPYMAPQALRGQRNEPAHLTYLLDGWAGISGHSKDDIARITTHNANSLFNLGLEEDSKIAYPIRGSLYLNITSRCTNACVFCVRNSTSFVKGHNLRLDREPSLEDVLGAIGDPRRFKEIVFCGYGEPTFRLELVKAIAKKMKDAGSNIRLVTNGHGDLINSRSIARELVGLVDRVSVSLNADTGEKYDRICEPEFGSVSYGAVLRFIKDCVASGIKTEVTCLNLPEVDIAKCESIAGLAGADFRLRSQGVVG